MVQYTEYSTGMCGIDFIYMNNRKETLVSRKTGIQLYMNFQNLYETPTHYVYCTVQCTRSNVY